MRVSSAPRPAAERRGTPPCDAWTFPAHRTRVDCGQAVVGALVRGGGRLESSLPHRNGRVEGKPVPTRPPDWRKNALGRFPLPVPCGPLPCGQAASGSLPARRGRDCFWDPGRRPAETSGRPLRYSPRSTAAQPQTEVGGSKGQIPPDTRLPNGHGPRGVPQAELKLRLNVQSDRIVGKCLRQSADDVQGRLP